MANRALLQSKLEGVLGSEEVHFQAPPSIGMKYPAIVYEFSNMRNSYANNNIYRKARCYQVTLIDKNPDSEFVDKLLELPMCSFDRHFRADNLNHYIFTIYDNN